MTAIDRLYDGVLPTAKARLGALGNATLRLQLGGGTGTEMRAPVLVTALNGGMT